MEKPRGFEENRQLARKKIEKKAFFAYGANLDSVIPLNLIQARLVSPYLPGLLESMKKGEGREIRVSKAAFRKTIELLPCGSKRVGGQAGNMALDAARLGVLSYMHTPSRSGELLSLFRSNRVLVAGENGFVPAKEASDNSKPPVHLILEFKKGLETPSSNRFIASCENLNPSLCIDPLFSRNIAREIPEISRGFVAGFHLLGPKVFEERKRVVVKQLLGWKMQNPDLKIHLEWGSFISGETERLAEKHILPLVDCVGFNEDEIPSTGIGTIEKFLDKTKTVVLHTRDYSLAFSKEFEAKSLSCSLAFASCVAGFKASRGRAPTLAELKKTGFKPKKISPPKFDERKLLGKGISFAFSPSVEITPKFTVGLGDCFSMAFFLTLK